LESWEPSQHLLIDTGKPRKTCVEVAGRILSVICSIVLSHNPTALQNNSNHNDILIFRIKLTRLLFYWTQI